MTPERMAAIHAAAFAGGETWDGAAIRDLLSRPGTRSVVLPPDGFALVQILPPEAELLTIAVHPDAQGAGLGRTLLDRVRSAALSEDCTSLHLEVAADNARALALYSSAGFRETGRRAEYYARPGAGRVDALTLSISLAAHQSGRGPAA